jgi:hypothetical protein
MSVSILKTILLISKSSSTLLSYIVPTKRGFSPNLLAESAAAYVNIVALTMAFTKADGLDKTVVELHHKNEQVSSKCTDICISECFSNGDHE